MHVTVYHKLVVVYSTYLFSVVPCVSTLTSPSGFCAQHFTVLEALWKNPLNKLIQAEFTSMSS